MKFLYVAFMLTAFMQVLHGQRADTTWIERTPTIDRVELRQRIGSRWVLDSLRPLHELHPTAHILLVLDNSGSMEDQMEAMEEAVEQCIGLQPAHTRFKIIKYDTHVRIETGWIDAQTAGKALHTTTLEDYGGHTSMWFAMSIGLRTLDSLAPAVSDMVVFTDGEDTSSWLPWLTERVPGTAFNAEGVWRQWQGMAVQPRVFSVIMESEQGHKHHEQLERISTASGGMSWLVGRQRSALQRVFTALAQTVSVRTGYQVWCSSSKGKVLASNNDFSALPYETQLLLAYYKNDEIKRYRWDSMLLRKIRVALQHDTMLCLAIRGHAS